MSDFTKNIISVFNGALLAQLIPIIGSVFILRIYSPTTFGEYSSWLAIVMIVAVLLTLRLEDALSIVGDGLLRVKSVLYISVVCLCVAILGSLLLFLASKWFAFNFFRNSYELFFLIIPAALLIAVNSLWQIWAATEGLYRKLNIMRITQGSILILSQSVIGLGGATTMRLAIGLVVASIISFSICLFIMPRICYTGAFEFDEFLEFFKRYRNFLVYGLPSGLVNIIAAQLPVILVAKEFGSEVAGYLALTIRVLGAPMGLVGGAVLNVFRREAAQSFERIGNCRSLYLRVLMMLSAASVVFVVCTIFFSRIIFQTFYGLAWIESGAMAVWLIPLFAMRFVASPLSYVVYIVEKQHVDLLWQILLLLVTYATLVSASSYKIAILSYSIGYAFLYCIYLYISYQLSLGRESRI